MTRRTAGICLICTAAWLYATQFLTAAIFGSGVSTWSQDLFRSMMQVTNQGLILASKVALGVGIIYLIWAEVEAFIKR